MYVCMCTFHLVIIIISGYIIIDKDFEHLCWIISTSAAADADMFHSKVHSRNCISYDNNIPLTGKRMGETIHITRWKV